jgi:hypothetical protein
VRGSEIAAGLSDDLATRGAQIVAHVRAGHYVEPEFSTLTLDGDNGQSLEVQVMRDALKLGQPSDFFRPNVSYNEHETIAQLLGLVMLTAKVADAKWAAGYKWQAVTMEPLSSTAQMLRHSEDVSASAANAGAAPGDLYGQSGKLWISSSRLNADKYAEGLAVNYGLYTWPPSPAAPQGTPGPKPADTPLAETTVWQQPGMAHNRNHVDYSQIFTGMRPTGVFVSPGQAACGVELAAVAENSETFRLLANAPTVIRPATAGGVEAGGLSCRVPPTVGKKKNGSRGLLALAILAVLLGLVARQNERKRKR